MTNLRKQISGTFSHEQLGRLSWPVAWSGTVSTSDQEEQEADRSALVDEAREALETCPDAVAVEIQDGEVVALVTADELDA